MTDSATGGGIPDTFQERLREILDPVDLDKVTLLVSKGPDPAGSWDRLVPMIEANPAIATDETHLRRVCAIAGVWTCA